MPTPGEKLFSHLKSLPGGVEAFSRKSGIKRSKIYYNIKQEPLTDAFVKSISDAGIDIAKIIGTRVRGSGVEIPVVLSPGRIARVELPEKFNKSDVEKIARILKAYIE